MKRALVQALYYDNLNTLGVVARYRRSSVRLYSRFSSALQLPKCFLCQRSKTQAAVLFCFYKILLDNFAQARLYPLMAVARQ